MLERFVYPLSQRISMALWGIGSAPRLSARWVCAVAGLVGVLLGGCASLPDQVVRRYSEAHRDVADSALARIAAATLAETDDPSTPAQRGAVSGLRLLPGGDDAFEARLALVRAAEKSIDAQYYLVADDRSGRQFLRGLADAAARGVRVRLLVDDLNAGATKGLLAEFASRDNVELRMFNPLPVRTGSLHSRVLLSLHKFDQVNRRMHNKLLVADNSFAITGGRNIADEYFGRSKPANFIDMDVLIAGSAVHELSEVFDAYWNSALAYPLQSLIDVQRMAKNRPAVEVSLPIEFVPHAAQDDVERDGLGAQLARQRVQLQAARVRVIADAVAHPEPRSPDVAMREGSVMRANLDLLQSARQEVLVVSPYLIPMPSMLDAFDAASAGGARISVVTNSLATTDEPLAHYGYARYREKLVRMGIALYELMPVNDPRIDNYSGAHQGSLARLHAKLAVVDRRWFYVGSMNMDRRSAHCNTELGLVVESGALAGELVDMIHREHFDASYSVRQRLETGGIEWTVPDGGQDLRMTRDPVIGWAQRIGWSLLSSLIDEDYL
ncbi:phospholipase D-like domain-containing protein [Variovorax fucosicus]|uniref:phospholipase D-like domain-containing protein n=1 Tax=Variovorax fucosicus TaxID=3053517 RepID=UPI002577AB79|nr:phospholipase D family protein [Variovorax sp. J22G47]MDM0057596.1 phospholipase D family protein [Variovorax sp. J22G47]